VGHIALSSFWTLVQPPFAPGITKIAISNSPTSHVGSRAWKLENQSVRAIKVCSLAFASPLLATHLLQLLP
jgi:hypothetical protein